MHAYLLVGNSPDDYESEITLLSKKLNADILKLPLEKIEDVRDLGKLTKLGFAKPTLIVAKNIDESTPYALNAFLKNLEEPPTNLYFALTCKNLRRVLPTITSRCQVINLEKNNYQVSESEKLNFENFLNMSSTQKLSFFDTIKDRGKAIQFVDGLIFFLHNIGELKNMDVLIKTLTRLKANGTVNLHLTNLAINIK